MQNRIEKKIANLLKTGQNNSEIFDELTSFLFQKKLSQKEIRSIFSFAINSGLHKQLISVCADLFHEKKLVPWPHIIQILHINGVKPKSVIIESVLKGARKQNAVEYLALTRKWDHLDPRFKQYRADVEEIRQEEFRGKKASLFEKLGFYKSQRMLAEEKKTLSLLLRMFPNDSEVRDYHLEFEKRWARELISKRSSMEMNLEFVDRRAPEANKEDEVTLTPIVTTMIELTKRNPSWGYNFAVGLKMIGSPGAALKLITLCPRTLNVEWLELELLLEAKRYVDCLNSVHEIEMKYSDDPETTFAATYTRAKALYGLGQESRAKELLLSIVNVRPGYRSAHSLLTEWSERLS